MTCFNSSELCLGLKQTENYVFKIILANSELSSWSVFLNLYVGCVAAQCTSHSTKSNIHGEAPTKLGFVYNVLPAVLITQQVIQPSHHLTLKLSWETFNHI